MQSPDVVTPAHSTLGGFGHSVAEDAREAGRASVVGCTTVGAFTSGEQVPHGCVATHIAGGLLSERGAARLDGASFGARATERPLGLPNGNGGYDVRQIHLSTPEAGSASTTRASRSSPSSGPYSGMFATR